ncbi:discoidin domain-containing protein [Lysinibacillus fusiformis]|uniref:discoidin domain-containing protein n=1 Tax=Lysinibacillus fusiformis TaxID=28031 RepID=UPI001E524ECF|nr:discoidin domain-containing protein [Lysinibacillus fusiformis]MCE4043360.1 discoidin domain-containing protein [Lysinibacillus fusiformis]
MSELTWYNLAMTSDTTPVPLVASASNVFSGLSAWKAFNGTMANADDCWLATKSAIPYLQLDFGKQTKVQAFRMKTRLNNEANSPNAFTISGSNDENANFTILHSVTGKNDWVNNTYFNIELSTPVNYRYYRMHMTAFNGTNAYVGIGLFEFGCYPPPPPVNKTLLSKDNKVYSTNIINIWHDTKMTSNTTPAPYVASASSTQSTTYAPWKAFDGVIAPLDNQSSWSATATLRNGWLQLDYGRKVTTNKVEITILEFTTSPKDFQILGSDDNNKWDIILDVKNEVWLQTGSNESKTYNFKKDVSYRYYRINIDTVSTPNKQPMITELKFGYDRKELMEIPSVTVQSFDKYGKFDFANLDLDMDIFTYVLPSTIKEKQLTKKPLSIGFD